MPIVIVNPQPGEPWGPGFGVQGSSITIPFDPSTAYWQVKLWDSDKTVPMFTCTQAYSGTQFAVTGGYDHRDQRLVTGPVQTEFTDGKPGRLEVQLISGFTVSDTGEIGVTFDNHSGVSSLQTLIHNTGALSQTQAEQLAETHQSVFPAISMDSLLLEELTSGPQGGFVNAQLGAWIMGVIVRIATVPEDAHVNTPDADYWTRTLAVVRIYRGTDLWKRVPVHTSNKLIDFTEEGLVSAVASILPLQWLLQISIQVSFGAGVTGQVFLMRNP